MKYIAYGSNMVQEQMAFRCPDARLIGTGYIAGARLEFYLHATVEKTGDQRNRVPVAVWGALTATKDTPATTSRSAGPCTCRTALKSKA